MSDVIQKSYSKKKTRGGRFTPMDVLPHITL